jgi:aldehyde:ferredoxin oxidoreductase
MLTMEGAPPHGRRGARRAETEVVDDVLDAYIGGRGVATRLAHERIPFDADPLGPENRCYFTTGPMQASSTSSTGRVSATAVSPLTDGLLSTNAGGFVSRNLLGTGNAVVELERQFNNRRGFDRSDDDLPSDRPDFEAALDAYYDARGWTDDGVVPEESVGTGVRGLVRS